MAEYIEREKARELIKNFGKGAIEDGKTELDPVDDIILLAKGVDLIPAADVVEVRHGKWLKTEEPMGWHDVDCIECSACHGSWVIADDVSFEDYVEGWKYCPNCGAKMDGKDDNDG